MLHALRNLPVGIDVQSLCGSAGCFIGESHVQNNQGAFCTTKTTPNRRLCGRVESQVVLVRQCSCSSQEVSRDLARRCLYRGSFGLLLGDHSALAVDRFMNAVVSHTSGKEISCASLESDVR